MTPEIKLHKNDLPADLDLGPVIAVDTETMGLDLMRDRLCLVQLSDGQGVCHLVKIDKGQEEAPNLKKILEDPERQILFHFARFDVGVLLVNLGIQTTHIYCTKIASKLARTYTDRHGLRDLCRELLGVDISKQQQQTDWGADEYTQEQLTYAATDVLYLHQLKEILEVKLEREGRKALAESCFAFIMERIYLDLSGFSGWNIFEH